MPIVERKDNIGDTTSSTGTGTINLSAVAQVGSRIFAGNVTTGATVRYLIETADKSEWEVGEGVFTDGSPDTLTRVTVYASSNAGALVNFSAGTKNVSMIASAKDFDIADNIHSATAKTTPVDADEFALADSAASYGLKLLTWANIKATLLTWLRLSTTIIPVNAPQGFLINGKISVTDAAGITVAIKTLAGTDPSATDPVYVRIGDTVRTISTALSVAKADGTNWLNAGSAELATKEIDYFVYLGYAAGDSAVHIGFSRIPSAALVSDIAAGTTNEKGSCWNGSIAGTDTCENIGRFAATLSAGAGYTWSVPTYTAINLIQRPIYETRWLDSVPTYNNTIGNGINTLSYKVAMNVVQCRQQFSIGSSTTTGTVLNWKLPFTLSSANNVFAKGTAKILDNGTRYYMGTIGIVSSTTFSWINQNDAGQGQLAATSGPMTWATGDLCDGWFEIYI